MRLSIAIPAYNRPVEMRATLDSLADQCPENVEVVICEDCSPKKSEIEKVTAGFSTENPNIKVLYYSNVENIGYDANLRNIILLCSGEFIFFLGDDDLVPPGAIKRVLEALNTPGIGVLLRSWNSFNFETGKMIDEHRYFKGDQIFDPGHSAIVAFFRRSVFISGLTIHRESALNLSSDKFDGTLLYQLYLVSNILNHKSGYYLDFVTARRRTGGVHFFGSSRREVGFAAGRTEVEHSLRFVSGLLKIADSVDGPSSKIARLLYRDIATYSYPILEVQASRISRNEFSRYALNLSRLGLGKNPYFWLYVVILFIFGAGVCNYVIKVIYRIVGRTPLLFGSRGVPVNK